MRQLHFSKQIAPGEDARLLSYWSSLSAECATLAEPSVQLSIVEAQASYAIALARQYQSPVTSMETLLAAAHDALVCFLNQCIKRPDKISRQLAHVLREVFIRL